MYMLFDRHLSFENVNQYAYTRPHDNYCLWFLKIRVLVQNSLVILELRY